MWLIKMSFIYSTLYYFWIYMVSFLHAFKFLPQLINIGSNYYFHFTDTITKVQKWRSSLKPQMFSGIAEVRT